MKIQILFPKIKDFEKKPKDVPIRFYIGLVLIILGGYLGSSERLWLFSLSFIGVLLLINLKKKN